MALIFEYREYYKIFENKNNDEKITPMKFNATEKH